MNDVSPRTFVRGDEVELAEALLDALGPYALHADGRFWTWSQATGAWHAQRPEDIDALVSRYAGSAVAYPRAQFLALSHARITGAVRLARARLISDQTRPHFPVIPTGIAFSNCFVRVENGTVLFVQNCPTNLARHAFPFPYQGVQPTPRLDDFFASLFADSNERLALVALLQEFLGTCMIGNATSYQKCLVLLGKGANGKSSILTIAASIFPTDAVVVVPPQEWGQRFRTSALAGALVNLVSEVPTRNIAASAVFKSVVGGDAIQGENKFEKPFTFRPVAGHLFSANELPNSDDRSQGFWRRFMVIPLTRDMTALPTHQKNVGEAIVAAELPAIVAWALEGARRVQYQGGYTEPLASRQIVSEWRTTSDPVLSFLAAECGFDPAQPTHVSVLHAQFQLWAQSSGFKGMAVTTFGRRLVAAGFEADHRRTGNFYPFRLLRPRPPLP